MDKQKTMERTKGVEGKVNGGSWKGWKGGSKTFIRYLVCYNTELLPLTETD